MFTISSLLILFILTFKFLSSYIKTIRTGDPNETNFLRLGRKLGNQIENGKYMFIYQAYEAFKLWQGIEPSVNNEVLNLLNND